MPTKPSAADALAPLRKEIETLDRRIIALLNKRLEVSTRIGAFKREHKTHNSPFDPNREESLLRLLIGENPGPLSAASLRAIYREIFSSSRARQSPLTIGYVDPHDPKWGCEHPTSFLAACARFGVEENYRSVPRLDDLLKATASGRLTLSLLCAGALAAHGEEVARRLHVCGEIPLRADAPLGGKVKEAADDHPFFLVARREAEPDATPLLPGTRLLFLASHVGKAAGAASLLRWCRVHRARLRFHAGASALIDLRIPGAGGKTAARQVLPPSLPALEESLQAALALPPALPSPTRSASLPRLHLLGAYLAEESA